MKMNKKAQGIAIETIIKFAIAIVVLTVAILVITKYGRQFLSDTGSCVNKGGTPMNSIKECTDANGAVISTETTKDKDGKTITRYCCSVAE